MLAFADNMPILTVRWLRIVALVTLPWAAREWFRLYAVCASL